MAPFLVRASGPTDSTRPRAGALGFSFVTFLVAGCVSYEPAPVDVSQVLHDLEALRWEASGTNGDETSAEDGATPRELAAFAVAHNPTLSAVRGRIGVSNALLIEAGLLPDPTIGWDAMDVLAVELNGESATSVEYLAGLGLSIPLLRPGERDAKQGVAGWRLQEALRRVTEAEWLLARDVHVASESVLEAQELLTQNARLTEVAETTREYFQRARQAGAATAIQDNLAVGELLGIRAERIRLEARLREVRHALNALLGLTPTAVVPVVASPDLLDPLPSDPKALAETAVERRPDLEALLALYQAAEEEVRLEVSRQFPQISIGTGISIVPGFFSGFNRYAIATALARRAQLASEIEARVHEVRRDVHDTFAAYHEARRQSEYLESAVLPNAEESLRLAREAFDAGEVTLLEILTLQRTLVDARTRVTEMRAERSRRRWKLLAASGQLLGTPRKNDTEDEEIER